MNALTWRVSCFNEHSFVRVRLYLCFYPGNRYTWQTVCAYLFTRPDCTERVVKVNTKLTPAIKLIGFCPAVLSPLRTPESSTWMYHVYIQLVYFIVQYGEKLILYQKYICPSYIRLHMGLFFIFIDELCTTTYAKRSCSSFQSIDIFTTSISS